MNSKIDEWFHIGPSSWVTLTVKQGSAYCVTRHRLAQPDLEQTLRHEALDALSRIVDDPELRLIAFGREQVRLYDELIEEIGGYETQQGSLMEIPGWRDAVPTEHKLEVMARRCVFLRAPGPTGADSGSASSDSPAAKSAPVPGKTPAPNTESSPPAKDAE